MTSKLVVSISVALLVSLSPASAKGKHISCQLSGNISDGTKGGGTRVERTLNFYLDDTHSQVTAEGSELFVSRTKSYSDTEVWAEIGTAPLADFFGRFTDGPVTIRIDRTTGQAIYAAKFLPTGAEVAIGPCHEIAPPPAKF